MVEWGGLVKRGGWVEWGVWVEGGGWVKWGVGRLGGVRKLGVLGSLRSGVE